MNVPLRPLHLLYLGYWKHKIECNRGSLFGEMRFQISFACLPIKATCKFQARVFCSRLPVTTASTSTFATFMIHSFNLKYLLEIPLLFIRFAYFLLLTFQRSGYEVYLVEAPYKDPVVSIYHTLALSLCSNKNLFGVPIGHSS